MAEEEQEKAPDYTVALKAALPKGDRNGLDGIRSLFGSEMKGQVLVVGVLQVSEAGTNIDTEQPYLKVRLAAVEALRAEDARLRASSLLEDAFKARTGADALEFPEDEPPIVAKEDGAGNVTEVAFSESVKSTHSREPRGGKK